MEKVILTEYAGQRADVHIVQRDDGSVYVIFTSVEGYGWPKLELAQLEALLVRCKALASS